MCPESVWTEEMSMTDMYRIALKCPCNNVRCSEILLRLRMCYKVKYEVNQALDFLLN